MKKRFAFIMIFVFLFTLFGCAAEPVEKDPIQEFIDNKNVENGAFVAYGKDEEEMKDPLTICIDVEYTGIDTFDDPSIALNEFLNTLDQSGGLTDVTIEYIPPHGADRETKLDRIRVELMTGAGPDVFIMNCPNPYSLEILQSKPLFPFPEKVMESGMFLPLDDYMENNAQYADWEKQTQSVLAAGRNEEGQQLIPLSYSVPVLCYRASDVTFSPEKKNLSWTDILNDPALLDAARPAMDMIEPAIYEGELQWSMNTYRFTNVLGRLADFKNEELCFTEEELFSRITECYALQETTKEIAPDGVEEFPCTVAYLGWDLHASNPLHVHISGADTVESIGGNEPLTLVPIYSDDGGVTATVLSYAAVNRNTQRAEDAYTVIDLLMRDYVQRHYALYDEMLLRHSGIAMHEGIMLEETHVGGRGQWFLTDQRFEELSKVRDQITAVNFQSELDQTVHEIVLEWWIAWLEGGTEEDLKAIIETHYETMQRMVRE